MAKPDSCADELASCKERLQKSSEDLKVANSRIAGISSLFLCI